jgi:hypothetical protein
MSLQGSMTVKGEAIMIRVATRAAIALTSLLALAVGAASAAPEPTLSDIAGCNEQAAKVTGAASALPHPGWRPSDPNRSPSASPRTDATRPDIVPGPADRGVGTAPRPGGSAAPLTGAGAPGEKTDPSGSVITETPDPLLRGMDASKADDAQYRAAYRDCMRARLAR